jgi:hypothetical protein
MNLAGFSPILQRSSERFCSAGYQKVNKRWNRLLYRPSKLSLENIKYAGAIRWNPMQQPAAVRTKCPYQIIGVFFPGFATALAWTAISVTANVFSDYMVLEDGICADGKGFGLIQLKRGRVKSGQSNLIYITLVLQHQCSCVLSI